jgi:hypothetical protein
MHRTLNIYVRGHKGVSQKVYGLKHVYYKYIETKVALRINVTPPPRLKRPGSSVSHTFLFRQEKKNFFFGCVFNKFCTAPVASLSVENLLGSDRGLHFRS